jgi:hypothetical protein
MKSAISISILLLAALCSTSFAETYSSEQSFRFGENDAAADYKIWPWFLAGFACQYLALATYGMIETRIESRSSALPSIAYAAVLSLPLFPALFQSNRRITSDIAGIDLGSYRKGYVRKARQKSVAAIIFGEAVSWGSVLPLALLFLD